MKNESRLGGYVPESALYDAWHLCSDFLNLGAYAPEPTSLFINSTPLGGYAPESVPQITISNPNNPIFIPKMGAYLPECLDF